MLINFKKIYFILLFLGISFLFGGQVKALTCETDTMHAGLQCRSADLKSWNKGTATTAGCNVETVCPANPTNGTYANNCTTNTCVLSCTTGYTPCGGSCVATISPTAPCSTYDTCNNRCSACNSGYSFCSTNYTCVATQTCLPGQTFNACTNTCTGSAAILKLGADSVSGTNIIQSASASYSTLFIPELNRVGIGGSTVPSTFLQIFGGTGAALDMSGGIITGLNLMPLLDDEAVPLGYLKANYSASSSSLWSGTRNSNIWNGDTGAGNVGIGTSSPATKLDVYGNAFFGFTNRLKIQEMGESLSIQGTAANNDNSKKSLILNAWGGDVVIGTTTPTARLGITGAGTGTGVVFRTAGSTNSPGITVLDSGKIGNRFSLPVALFQTDTLADAQYADDGSKPTWRLSYSGTPVIDLSMGNSYQAMISNPYSGGSIGGLQFRTGGLGTTFTRMTISQTGNVGIGTASPNARLNVVGADNSSSNFSFNVNANSGTSTFLVRNDGAVAINNRTQLSADSTRLYIAGSLAPNTTSQETVLRLYRPWQSGVSFAEVVDFSLGKYAAGQTGTQLDIKLANTGVGGAASSGAADVTVMSLLSNGHVGIGTSTPTGILSLNSGVNALNFSKTDPALWNYNNTQYLRFDDLLVTSLKVMGGLQSTAGNLYIGGTGTSYVMGSLAIGSTTAMSKLDVHGLIKMRVATSSITADEDVINKAYLDGKLSSVSTGGEVVGVTTATATGDNSGYASAHAICDAQYPDSHVCSSAEVLNSISRGIYISVNGTHWIFNGPPAFTAQANDCNGRTSAANNVYGTVWVVGSAPQGYGMLTTCQNSNAFVCCK